MSTLYADPSQDARARRQLRRSGSLVVALLVVLVVAVGATATVDLRRLQSPEGTAGAFVEAARDGDCDRVVRLLVLRGPSGGPGGTVTRGDCQRLQALYAGADVAAATRRGQPAGGATAYVDVVLHRGSDSARQLLALLRRGGRWQVLDPTAYCAPGACAPAEPPPPLR